MMNVIEWLKTNGIEHLWWDTRGYKVVIVQKSKHSQYVEKSMFARSLDGIA